MKTLFRSILLIQSLRSRNKPPSKLQAQLDIGGKKMRILLLGSGGREHAIASRLVSSESVQSLYVSPGNGGMATLHAKCHLVDLDPCDPSAVVDFVNNKKIELTVVGPEAPLAAGVVDAVQGAGFAVFGPTRAAAQLEVSKAYSKAFMERWRLPTAESKTFSDYAAAKAFLQAAPWPVVIKASGLAAGKGVVLPHTMRQAEDTLRGMMKEGRFGSSGETVVIEERISGPEVSLLCFSDGKDIAVMPTARDHKRLMDGDLGPNTGGMGAYAPVPEIDTESIQIWTDEILRPTIAGLSAQGTPYVGILYAGLMLTARGPKILEFNCRFGDPEAQAILPLLDSDLATLMMDCARGCLDPNTIKWKPKSAATVVLASGGYPLQYEKGFAIHGIDKAAQREDTYVFQAGTSISNHTLVTSGGRVLCVTGLGEDLASALETAYTGLADIDFEASQHRTDIGWTSRNSGRKR